MEPWYNNPYFLITFGFVVALGLMVLTLAYSVILKVWSGRDETHLHEMEMDVKSSMQHHADMIGSLQMRLEHFADQAKLTSVQIGLLSKTLTSIQEEDGGFYGPQKVRVVRLRKKEKESGEGN